MGSIALCSAQSIDQICSLLGKEKKISRLFRNCFFNTLETTTEILDDKTSFVFTGDIPAMWLRDSSTHVRHYLPFASSDDKIRRLNVFILI